MRTFAVAVFVARMLGMGDDAGVGSNELVFNVSMVLYGRAVQARNESRGIRIARPHDARQRRADCGILAVVLAHAALESAWHWEMQVAGVQPPPTWPRELENGIRRVADARGRPVPSGMSEADKSDFELLCAWRNFLQHADARARQRLAEKLGADFHQHLGADLAEWAIEVLDTYARHFAGSMGGQPLGPSHLVWAGGTYGLYAVPDAPNPEGLTCWDRWIPH